MRQFPKAFFDMVSISLKCIASYVWQVKTAEDENERLDYESQGQ